MTTGATALRSFGEQALHYFRREHESIPQHAVAGPAAWRGEDLADPERWLARLDADELAELDDVRRALRARGASLETLGREDFAFPRLAPRIAEWRHELREGRGFVVVRGLPVEGWDEEDAARIYWGLGLHLGRPGAQNPQGEHLGHVIDTGEDADQPFVRRYRTAGDIAYHCDLADVVGLLCLRTGRRGGASRIVSSVSVFNELRTHHPELVARLFDPFLLDSRDEQGGERPPYIPVPACRHARGVLRTFYHSDYFRSVTRHPEVPPFSDLEQQLFDRYEAIAESPALRLDMQFEPGDIQLLSNHFVLHARTAYEDDPEPARRRHLLRLWLSLD